MDHLHSNTNVCAKFDKPWLILCPIIIRARFGLYVNMLKVTVTLTFDLKINRNHLHPETHVCAKFDKPRSMLCLVIIRTRFDKPRSMLCLVIIRTRFDKPRSMLCLVIIRTRFGLYQYVDGHCDP